MSWEYCELSWEGTEDQPVTVAFLRPDGRHEIYAAGLGLAHWGRTIAKLGEEGWELCVAQGFDRAADRALRRPGVVERLYFKRPAGK